MQPERFGPPPQDGPVTLAPRMREESDEEYQLRVARRQKLEVAAARKLAREARWRSIRSAAPSVLSTLFELLGIGIVAYAVWTHWPWIGGVIAGVGVIIVGVALDPPQWRAPEEEAAHPRAGRYEGP